MSLECLLYYHQSLVTNFKLCFSIIGPTPRRKETIPRKSYLGFVCNIWTTEHAIKRCDLICKFDHFSQSNPKVRLDFPHQQCFGTKSESGSMANLYVKAVPPADLNRNTEWFLYPGVWTTYILILFFAWLLVLSVFGCSPGMAWTIVNLSHFAVCASIFLVLLFFWSGFYCLSVISSLDVGLLLTCAIHLLGHSAAWF